MPAHECLGTNDRYDPEDRWEPTIELDEEQAIAAGKPNSPRTLRRSTVSCCLSTAFSASRRLFDLKSAANRRRARRISATIAASVRRFSHWFNADDVFGTHRCTGRPLDYVVAQFAGSLLTHYDMTEHPSFSEFVSGLLWDHSNGGHGLPPFCGRARGTEEALSAATA